MPEPVQVNDGAGSGRVYAVQNGDMFVYVYQHEPPYRVEPLSAAPAGPPSGRPPSWLLSASREVVPFTGRESELAVLAQLPQVRGRLGTLLHECRQALLSRADERLPGRRRGSRALRRPGAVQIGLDPGGAAARAMPPE
jgi:hypothetical protein